MTNTSSVPRRILAPDTAHGLRLDRFLSEALRDAGISREKIKQAIAQGLVSHNGRTETRARTPVLGGDMLECALPSPASSLAPEAGDLCVLYRDESMAVLDKPAGLTVHPCPSQPENTLAGRLVARFPELAAASGPRPGIVHRLDKDTSGLLLVALTEHARLTLTRAFALREVGKEYLALVQGVPVPPAAAINAPIGRHPALKTKMAVLPLDKGGREAHSEYRTLYADPRGLFSLVAVRIHTGRTHQIRVHMASLGHPLWGDRLYGTDPGKKTAGQQAAALPKAPRQMLHAWKLSFPHPAAGPADPVGQVREFRCPPPRDFQDFAAVLLARQYLPVRVVITGSPGCGKSALLQMLAQSGCPTWSADAAVRAGYEKGGDGAALLKARFGSRFVSETTGTVDKTALFQAMRADAGIRREVEGLIHPMARHEQELFWTRQAQAFQAQEPLAFAEVPLYLESAAYPGDAVGNPAVRPLLVGVYCPFRIREERLRRIRGWDDTTIAAMESWQWPEERKIRAADIVIDNSGSLDDLTHKTEALIRVVRGIAERRLREAEERLAALWK